MKLFTIIRKLRKYVLNEALSKFLIGCVLLNNFQLYPSILFVCLWSLKFDAGLKLESAHPLESYKCETVSLEEGV